MGAVRPAPRERPRLPAPEPDGPGFWAVTRHADIQHVSRHPEIFSSYAGGMLAFFDHPGQWQRLLADRSLLRTLPDEVIRWVSPVITMRRTTVVDTELAGQKIPTGDKVVLYYPSGNRDSAVFADADVFDIGRDPNPHIGLGGGGPHFCLGAHLARMEVRVLFEVLAERLPDIAPAGPVRRLRSNFVNSIKEMPVRVV